MHPYVFGLGDIVIAQRNVSGIRSGQYLLIKNTNGYIPNTPTDKNAYYHVSICDSDGKSKDDSLFTVYQDQIEAVKDREMRLKFLNEKLKSKESELEDVKKEIDFITHYVSKEDYLAHKIKEALDNNAKPSDIKKMLKSKVPDYLIY